MKFHFAIAILSLTLHSYSQDLESDMINKGTLAFGINSSNLFDIGSDIFSSQNSDFQIFDWQDADSLVNLKYFYKDQKCLRLGIGINFRSDKVDEIVQAFDDDLLPIEGELVRNIFIEEFFRIGLRVGIEKNYSKRKWRYFRGMDFGFGLSTGRNRIINGNPIPLYLGAVLDEKLGVDVSLGPSLHYGFEYMIAKNASVGVELNWGITFMSSTFGDQIVVTDNGNGQAIELLIEGDNSQNSISVENSPGAKIFALIYLGTNKK